MNDPSDGTHRAGRPRTDGGADAIDRPDPSEANVDSDVVRLETGLEGDPDGVVRLVLDDPDRRNALSREMADGIVDAIDAIEGSDTRCVVVEGCGPAFCAGGDVAAMAQLQATDLPLEAAVRHVIRNTARCVRRTAECEFPTVAAIDGPAIGAGGALALACDLQLAHEDARIGFGFREVGLAIDSGVSYFLPRFVGDNVARELVFTGEQLDAERARDRGLVNHVYADGEFEEGVREFVERVASGPPIALRASKRLLRDAGGGSLSTAIEREAEAQAAALASQDHREGAEAFLERREPEFSGR
ncbi:enoyl-CoA hydratase/carnithine racemase [Halalkaliarchaeum desulfuricum]|uniref:Enoyl-CoA hydratase/carnithine racemase n=1 Tax=Halalkaliarchaeum desulfuricum TaxID=2055893 RepID=A0A343TKF8_9EURY|nr:enoyl-CoA hydratase-related protein [Halalkaliarchaeum desulfuricum]AUX09580.1 enoyl-CoA hydratase/carnithine racemase [Halalkaliarchaeum desulfuricum]